MVAARQAYERAALLEIDVIHEAAHQKDAETARLFIERFGRDVVVIEALAVVAYLDIKLVFGEDAAYRKACDLRIAPVLDRIRDRFSRGQADIVDLVL